MIVSVTVLGARGKSQQAIADGVVGYLKKGRTKAPAGRRPGSVIELPSPTGGTVAYYADSTGLRPGRWLLGRDGAVESDVLANVLGGEDPSTGAPLLSGSGHAARAAHGRLGGVVADPNAEWHTSRQVATLLGVSDRYVRQLCRKAITSGGEAIVNGIERTPDNRGWQIHRDALSWFEAQRKPKRIVVGYDLTYSAPKSVSVLWAGVDDTTKAAMLEAFDEAVAAGTRYFERHALVVRSRGEQQHAESVFAADYFHATNRALEPQLHHHVVVANYGRTADGEGRALDARMLFLHAKTAGYIAAAELRHQLTARLGVQWEAIRNGIAEIAGVPEAARDAMSTRAKEIAEAVNELDFHSPRARQVAAWDTRAAKEHGVDLDALVRVWDERLRAMGYGEAERAAVLGRVDAPALVAESDVERLFADLSRVAGVTANEAVFDRRRVVQLVAEFADDRLSGDAIDELADRFLAQPAVVRLGTGQAKQRAGVIRRDDGQVIAVPFDALYSTRPMLELEARCLAQYRRGREAGVGVVGDAVLAGVFADERFARLSDEQRRFVEVLTSSGLRIQAAVGAAGSGKTTALEAAVEAWHRAGYDVLGTAVGGTQTVVLGEEAHVEARTVASVIARYFHFDDIETITDRTIVLIDEASLVSTQDFALLAQAVAERGATMRLVGDPAQHTAVAAGGVFRYLVEHYGDEVPALTHIYRQQGPAMAEVRLANAEYREGKIEEALDRLVRDGRITEAESAEQALDLLTCAWYVERQHRLGEPDRRSSSMTAEHHFERVALNARARSLLQADGSLSGTALSVAGLSFQSGDEVIARVGDRSLRTTGATRRDWVRNGSLGVVREVHEQHLVVDFERWGRVVVPANYIDQEVSPGVRGGLQHAYALTTHAAEGSTYAIAVPLLTDASSRAGTYVGITRGQFDLQAVLIRRRALVPPPTDDQLPTLHDETDALRATARRLESEAPERLASEVDPLAARVHELAQLHTVTEIGAQRGEIQPSLYERVLEERARVVGAKAVVDPDADVLAHLGARPTGGKERGIWDQTVAAIAVWREREQVVGVSGGPGPTWALGPWPSSQGSLADYRAIAALIRTAERWPRDAWLWGERDEGPTPLSANSLAKFESGEETWHELSEDELRAVAQGIDGAIADVETRLVNLDRITELRTQLPNAAPTDEETESESTSAGDIRSSLEHYRILASNAHAEAVRRGLTDTPPGFLDAPGGQIGPEVDLISSVPDGPVIVP